jgi:four helix bundle protein
MGDFLRLKVWHAAQQMTVNVYRISGGFPRSEQFGLTAQLRRAAVSVSSNIAEGAGRGNPQAFRAFLRIARGSLHEVRSQLDLAVRLGYLSNVEAIPVLSQAEEVSRMLSGLLRSKNLQPRIS